ncbi:MAG: signal recognition particle-docking protein FtsY, partial [Nanohaloarchaea archaeon QH_8_44_6]
MKSTVAEKRIEEDQLDPLLEKLRLKLLQSNVSLEAAEEINEKLREEILGEEVKRGSVEDRVNQAMKDALLELLDDNYDIDAEIENAEEPPVVFMMGFNGAGKTTTAAKLAYTLQEKNREVVLGAGDTFRAASIEQLKEH